MSGHIIDEFVTIFRLNLDDFKAGVKEAESQSRKLRDGQKKTFDAIEDSGKLVGETIKGVSREVIGLGLAFMGAQSITGFLANMATGAASADRFGKTLGMTVGQIWAWRKAMTGFGGQAGDADASIQAIQSAKMNFRLQGRLGDDQQMAFGRLGITGNDLRYADAGSILSKLSARADKMDPQIYASLLQQIGLSAPTISMLQQGKASVDKLLAKYEQSADGQERLANETEKLQEQMAELNAKLQSNVIKDLTSIFDALNKLVDKLPNGLKNNISDMLGGGNYQNAEDWLGDAIGGKAGAWIKKNMGAEGSGSPKSAATSRGAPYSAGVHGEENKVIRFLLSKGLAGNQALGIAAALYAESGLNPEATNKDWKDSKGRWHKGSGAYGIGQWLSKDRVANFKRVTGHDLQGSSIEDQLEFLWWELTGGDRGGRAVLSERGTGTATAMINRFLRPAKGYETIRDLLAASKFIASHQRGGNVVIHGGIHIKSAATDAKGLARDFHGALQRRMAVAQSDRVVNP